LKEEAVELESYVLVDNAGGSLPDLEGVQIRYHYPEKRISIFFHYRWKSGTLHFTPEETGLRPSDLEYVRALLIREGLYEVDAQAITRSIDRRATALVTKDALAKLLVSKAS